MKSLMTTSQAAEAIQAGKRLLISGDDKLLRQLPRGKWVGGTSPYFMGEEGGLHSSEMVQVIELPDCCGKTRFHYYEASELHNIPKDYPANGFTYILIPAMTLAHKRFAQQCSSWEGVFNSPLIGWITGVELAKVGVERPRVYNGEKGDWSEEAAAVWHVELPPEKYAQVQIINFYEQGDGPTITFDDVAMEVGECKIDGVARKLSEYLLAERLDASRPLVADYMGAMINVSIQAIDAAAGKVRLYAPVFPGVEYKIARPVADFESAFDKAANEVKDHPVFTCNCILNYLHAHLEGRKTGDMVGPITFGEIAYMLLNQTLAHLAIKDK